MDEIKNNLLNTILDKQKKTLKNLTTLRDLKIYFDRQAGKTYKEIAKEFKLSESQVFNIALKTERQLNTLLKK
jgi:Mor family transcriptional regulator